MVASAGQFFPLPSFAIQRPSLSGEFAFRYDEVLGPSFDLIVRGAGEQQVRNVDSSEGCFNLDLWMMSVVEAWAWDRPEEELVDREASPWDNQPRRPSHADKRKALQRQVLRQEIEACLAGDPSPGEMRALAERLLALAT